MTPYMNYLFIIVLLLIVSSVDFWVLHNGIRADRFVQLGFCHDNCPLMLDIRMNTIDAYFF